MAEPHNLPKPIDTTTDTWEGETADSQQDIARNKYRAQPGLPVPDSGPLKRPQAADVSDAQPEQRLNTILQSDDTDPAEYPRRFDPSGDESQEWQLDEAERGTGTTER